MTTSAVWIQVDPEHVVHALQEAVEKMNHGEAEVVLDFSSVPRIDPGAVAAMEELAGLAAGRSVQVVLRGVNADIYRVLKLVKLAQKFSFPA